MTFHHWIEIGLLALACIELVSIAWLVDRVRQLRWERDQFRAELSRVLLHESEARRSQ